MSKVKIIYYGHSCFKVEALSGSIILILTPTAACRVCVCPAD